MAPLFWNHVPSSNSPTRWNIYHVNSPQNIMCLKMITSYSFKFQWASPSPAQLFLNSTPSALEQTIEMSLNYRQRFITPKLWRPKPYAMPQKWSIHCPDQLQENVSTFRFIQKATFYLPSDYLLYHLHFICQATHMSMYSSVDNNVLLYCERAYSHISATILFHILFCYT